MRGGVPARDGLIAAPRAESEPRRILYDAGCAFCRWSLGWILRWDRRGRLLPVALQDPEADEFLSRMSEAERMASWHLVEPNGEVRSAGAAFPPLFRLLPGGRPLAAITAALPGLSERAYALVSRHRGRLGRAVGRGAVDRADALIARRGLSRDRTADR